MWERRAEIEGWLPATEAITLLATVDFATSGMKMPIPDKADTLRRWYDDVSSRPSAKA